MKIGIVTNLYPPFARGGAENVIVRTVEQLLGLGHDIFIITGQPKNQGTDPYILQNQLIQNNPYAGYRINAGLVDEDFRRGKARCRCYS